jgi:hypothetical protein
MLYLTATEQTLTPQCSLPQAFQFLERKCKGVSLWKYEQGMIGGQLVSNLSRQLPEHTLDPIATNGNAEPSPHNDADAARAAFGLAHQQVEAGCGQPPAMLFHKLNVAARAKKKDSISCPP